MPFYPFPTPLTLFVTGIVRGDKNRNTKTVYLCVNMLFVECKDMAGSRYLMLLTSKLSTFLHTFCLEKCTHKTALSWGITTYWHELCKGREQKEPLGQNMHPCIQEKQRVVKTNFAGEMSFYFNRAKDIFYNQLLSGGKGRLLYYQILWPKYTSD